MIVSDLAHLPTQLKTNTAFDQAIEFLRQEQWRGKPDGKIIGDYSGVIARSGFCDEAIPAQQFRNDNVGDCFAKIARNDISG